MLTIFKVGKYEECAKKVYEILTKKYGKVKGECAESVLLIVEQCPDIKGVGLQIHAGGYAKKVNNELRFTKYPTNHVVFLTEDFWILDPTGKQYSNDIPFVYPLEDLLKYYYTTTYDEATKEFMIKIWWSPIQALQPWQWNLYWEAIKRLDRIIRNGKRSL